MSNSILEILIKAREQASGVFDKVRGAAKNLNTSAAEIEKTMKGVSKQFEELERVGGRLVAAGIGPALFGGAAIRDAAAFEKQIAQIAAVAGESIGNIESLSAQVLDLSANLGNTKAETAASLFRAVSAGMRDAAESAKLLAVADELADASGTDLVTTTDRIIDTIKGFDLAFGDAREVADSLFVAVQSGNGTLSELTGQLGNISPLANALGIQFKDLITVVQALTSSGLPASRAFLAVRTVMEALTRPSAQLNRLFAQLGDGTAEATLKNRGLAGTLQLLVSATQGNRSELVRLIGSQQAASAITVLSANNFSKLTEAMKLQANAAGAVEKGAKVVEKSLGGRLEKTVAALAGAFTALGQAIGPVLQPLLDKIAQFATAFTKFAQENKTLVGLIGGIVVGLGALGVVVGTLAAAVGAIGVRFAQFVIVLTRLGPLVTGIVKLLGVLVTPVGLVTIAVVASIIQIIRLVNAYHEWRQATEDLDKMQKKAADSVEKLVAAGARAVPIKSTQELNELTAEEIDLYQEALISKLKLIGAERQLALIRGDTSAVEALSAAEKEVLKTIEASAEIEKRRADAGKIQIDVNQKVALSYQKTTADVQAYVDALNKVNEFNASNLIDTLDLIHQKTVFVLESQQEVVKEFFRDQDTFALRERVITFFRRNNQELISEERRFNAEKLRITKQTAQNSLSIAKTEFDQKSAIIKLEESDERVRNEKLLALAREFSAKRVNILKQEADAIVKQRDEAFKRLEETQKKLLSLDKQIRDFQIQSELDLQALRNQGLTEEEKRSVVEQQLEQLKSQTRQALEEKDFALAEDLAKKRIALIRENSTQLGDFFGQQQSEQESIKKAVELTAEAQGDVLNSLRGQKEEAAATAESQKVIADSLEKAASSAKSLVSDEANKNLLIEAKIDDTGAKATIAELTQPTSSLHSVQSDTSAIDAAIERIQQPTFSTHTVQVVTQQVGAPEGFAGGGHVRGPGSGTSDSILAMLSNGEFVMRAKAVKELGVGFLTLLNSLSFKKSKLRGFAMGGAVPAFRKSNFVPSTQAIPRFAAGGPVSGGGSGNLGTLKFDFGIGRSVEVRAAPEDAKKLEKEFTNITRGGVGVRRV